MTQISIDVIAKTEQALGALNKLTNGAGDLSRRLNQDASGALNAFGVNINSLSSPITLVAEGMKKSIQAAASWGDEMGDLAQRTGASIEDTSKLAATFELVGVSSGSLESAIKSMTKNGLALNMATMKDLARQYQAIQDPVKQNEFLFKNFGRAGAEMAEIMGRSSEELDKLSQSAIRSGKVIGEDAAGAAETFNTNMAILNQRVQGAQIAFGNVLIPTLNDALTSFDNLISITEILGAGFLNSIGVMSDTEAQAAQLAAAGIEPVTTATEELTAATNEATVSMSAMSVEQGHLSGWLANVAAAEAERVKMEELTGAASDLSFGMGELTKETLFNQAAAGLDKEASYQLAKAMGLINPAADAAKQILDDLTIQQQNGALSAGEYSGQVKLLADAIATLPDGKTVTVEYVTRYTNELNKDLGQRGRQGGAVGDGFASGGSFIVPQGFPNDTYPMRVTSGERVTVTPRGAASASGVTINFNPTISNGMDMEQALNMLVRKLQAAQGVTA